MSDILFPIRSEHNGNLPVVVGYDSISVEMRLPISVWISVSVGGLRVFMLHSVKLFNEGMMGDFRISMYTLSVILTIITILSYITEWRYGPEYLALGI